MSGRMEVTVIDFISELPSELVDNVLLNIDWKILCQICTISRGWNDVITKSRVWVSLCRREGFVAGPSVLSGRVSHKALFLHLKNRLESLDGVWGNLDVDVIVPRHGLLEYDEYDNPMFMAYADGLVAGGRYT